MLITRPRPQGEAPARPAEPKASPARGCEARGGPGERGALREAPAAPGPAPSLLWGLLILAPRARCSIGQLVNV